MPVTISDESVQTLLRMLNLLVQLIDYITMGGKIQFNQEEMITMRNNVIKSIANLEN